MKKIYYDSDINSDLIKGMKVGVIGYGSQGHAHALNLRDSGVETRVGLYKGSKSWDAAEKAELKPGTVDEIAKWADVLMFLTPDVPMKDIYNESVRENLRDGQTLLFAHGFNIHYKLIDAPANVNVAMIAPKGPGHRLRHEYVHNAGMPALVAVAQDATGNAQEIALSYAWGIGCGRGGVLETTFKEETETDLFGEQAVLCGGISELIKAGFETLVEAGYQPEAAYFECLHETKLIVDLLYEGGLSYMRYSISDTAEWGDYTAGPKVINQQSRTAMKEILAKIQDGTFAKEWIEENQTGRKRINAFREKEAQHPVEKVGKELRRQMKFIDAKEAPETVRSS